MSSPIQGISSHEPRDAPVSPAVQSASMLAVSGLLRVQRRWLLASRAGPQPGSLGDGVEEPGPDAPPPAPTETAEAGRSQRTVHLEDSEWSRLALGVTAEVLASIGLATSAVVLELEPDALIVHLPSSEPPRWPFTLGRSPQSWRLPRDSRIIAALSVTPATMSASRKAALVTVSESHGRRALLDLIAVGSTIMTGPWSDVGVKFADVAVELGTRRWSDLETLILVAFGPATAWLEGAKHVPDLAAALDELTVRCLTGTTTSSVCVIVPPWAGDPADRLLGEVVRFAEATAGVGALCCTSSFGARCRWELASASTGLPTLSFGNGRRLSMLVPAGYGFAGNLPVDALAPPAHPSSEESSATRARGSVPGPRSIEVAVLGRVLINGAPESFSHRRRLTELVTYLAMHPDGATTDAFATALWPERRVPLQTLANRLSEARRALGCASDGRPRLRKRDKRHLIVEFDTDWDLFRDLASEGRGADSWRRALGLVRGRPFDGLEQGEWTQLEGFAAAVEASVVGVACRLGEYSLGRAKPDLAHWAALQGLLVSPWDERLYRLLMRAADALGNRGGIDAALRGLAVALELEGDPLLGIHPETSALYRRLTARTALPSR
jgi:DNA-binding SARP family transcriptional activator